MLEGFRLLPSGKDGHWESTDEPGQEQSAQGSHSTIPPLRFVEPTHIHRGKATLYSKPCENDPYKESPHQSLESPQQNTTTPPRVWVESFGWSQFPDGLVEKMLLEWLDSLSLPPILLTSASNDSEGSLVLTAHRNTAHVERPVLRAIATFLIPIPETGYPAHGFPFFPDFGGVTGFAIILAILALAFRTFAFSLRIPIFPSIHRRCFEHIKTNPLLESIPLLDEEM